MDDRAPLREEYRRILERAKTRRGENKKFFRELKKKKSGAVDPLMARLHDEVFQELDCLDCANCCRGTGPLLRERDVARLAKALRMKPGAFTEAYLRVDEEGDFVFRELPCPFLGPDNYCSVYENRSGACRDYPHTDCISFKKYAPQMLKNSVICPGVFLIFERMRREI